MNSLPPAVISHLTAGRSQIGTSLSFHLFFAVLGVGLPLMMLVAEGMHLRTGDPVWRALARRWSKVFAVLFAVGAASGTIISFELGLLFPRFSAKSSAKNQTNHQRGPAEGARAAPVAPLVSPGPRRG